MTHSCALITGASSGIGEAFARVLPTTTDLLLTGRDGARLVALAAAVESEGRRVETLVADLADEAGRAALLDWAGAQPVDLLINNAGLGLFGPHHENSPAHEQDMVQVNCLAPVVLTQALLPGMLDRARRTGRRGGIIIVASTAAFFPLPRFTTYAASKTFDLQYALGLAGELAEEPIDVLALCPGPTQTDFFRRAGLEDIVRPSTATPETVAQDGLAALGRRPVQVVGATNRLAVFATRFVPRSLLIWAGRRWAAQRQLRGDK